MRMTREMRRALCVVTVAAFSVAACSSDDDKTDAPAATDAPGETSGGEATTPATAGGEAMDCGLGTGVAATGEPIVIGAVVGATGPADFSSASKGAQAYFDCVNANGGINGRPIQYIVEDDGWDPEKAVTVAKKLVEDDNVVGMVGSTSFVECAANSEYYAEQGVAVIAGVGVPRECFFSSNIAPVNQGPRLSGIGAASYAAEQGAKKIACIANVIPNFGGWVCQGIEAWGAEAGVEVQSFNGQPDLSDAETIMQQALAINPDAVVVVEAGPGVQGYLKAAEQLGATPKFYGPTSAYDKDFAAAVGDHWFGAFPAEIEFNTMDSTGPDNTLWQEVMAMYGPEGAAIDSFSVGSSRPRSPLQRCCSSIRRTSPGRRWRQPSSVWRTSRAISSAAPGASARATTTTRTTPAASSSSPPTGPGQSSRTASTSRTRRSRISSADRRPCLTSAPSSSPASRSDPCTDCPVSVW